MLTRFWWGSVLLLGVPAMLVLLAVGPVLSPEYRDPDAGRLDPVSAALSLAAILPIIYGPQEIARDRWHPMPAGAGMGTVLGWLLIRRQHRLSDPLLNLRLFTDRVFTSTLAGMFGYTMLFGGIMVVIAQ
jgi:MFS transporter, DHA2 family, multidrug resistance protein